MGDIVPTETVTTTREDQQTSAEPTQRFSERIEKAKVLERPDLSNQASYLLLSLNSLNPQKVNDKLVRLFQSGEIDPEDQVAFENAKREHEETYGRWRTDQLQKQHEKFQQAGLLNAEAENLDELYCIHSTDYPPSIEGNQVIVKTTTAGSDGEFFRTTVHFALNHTVAPVAGLGKGHSWENKNYVVISPLKGVAALNGSPYGFLPEDTWWGVGVEKGVKLPPGTKLIARRGDPKLAQIKSLEGIEVVEVEGNPHAQAYRVMQEKGIKIIDPNQFKGGQTLADQLGSFYGYHLGSTTREGAESYLRAEAVIESAADTIQAKEVTRLVEIINKGNDSPFPDWVKSIRFQALAQILFSDYFEAEDFPEVAFAHPQTGHQVSFDEVTKTMQHHYYSADPKDKLQLNLQNNPDFHSRMIAWVGLNVFDQLHNMAANGTKLSHTSRRMLEKRVHKVKENLDIIPPQLIGGLTTTLYTYL